MAANDEKELPSEQFEDIKNMDDRPQVGGMVMPSSLADLSEEEYKRLGRKATFKMDLAIMPMLTIMYILNYLDRVNIAIAKLANLEEDLGLSDVQYQTCVSILFVGYILMQIPSNMIASRVKWPGTYICAGMAVWGMVSACMCRVEGFSGLLVTRLFIGVVESIFFPGALYFLSLFYNRKQYALRAAILFSGSQLGNAFGGLLAIAILKLDGQHGLEGWRWLFLVEGVATTGFAIIFACLLPNSNKKVIGLNKIECEWVRWNFASDQGQEDNAREITPWKGFIMAVQDPKTWLLGSLLYMTYVVGAVNNFFPSVVGTLGYDREKTYLLTAPPFLLCVVVMIVNGFHSDHQRERFWHILSPLIVTLVANIIAVSTLNTGARYFAMMLLPGSFYGSAVVTLSWITNSLSQPSAKRAAAIAIINSICNTPNIWCSYLYYAPPRYLAAFIVNVIAAGLACGVAVMTRLYLGRQNKKLERGEDTGKSGPTNAQIAAGFRYLV